jgi:hypothetical protein
MKILSDGWVSLYVRLLAPVNANALTGMYTPYNYKKVKQFPGSVQGLCQASNETHSS